MKNLVLFGAGGLEKSEVTFESLVSPSAVIREHSTIGNGCIITGRVSFC